MIRRKYYTRRSGLDLLCVADLGTWVGFVMTFFGPGFTGWTPLAGLEGYATTSYIRHSKQIDGLPQSSNFQPIGTFISYLIQKLGWEDPSCRELANYYRLANLAGAGAGKQRRWRPTIYSDEVRSWIGRGRLKNGGDYDQWSMGLT